jgi:hypothetical protein
VPRILPFGRVAAIVVALAVLLNVSNITNILFISWELFLWEHYFELGKGILDKLLLIRGAAIVAAQSSCRI